MDMVVEGSSTPSSNPRALLFDKYEMGRLLGKGTFAKVYHARHLPSNSSVAVKVIQKDQIRRDPGLAPRIEREISVMRLVRHPSVVELKEVLATRSKIYLVMEYVRGGELFSRVARGGKLPEAQSRKLFHQLVSAVGHCHSRGVFHRDLKLENLLLDENGDLKVSDFGLSALPEQRRHDGLLHTRCGTPAYVAPEVLGVKGYDGARADAWSCGVVLFVMLAGFLPFQDENLMEMYRKISGAELRIPPWFSPDARRLVSRLLVADPEKRLSVSEVERAPWFRRCTCCRASPAPRGQEHSAAGDEGNGSPRFYSAFELISTMSSGFDLSGLFEEKRGRKGTVFTSRREVGVILEGLEKAGSGLGFGVRRAKDRCGVRMEGRGKLVVVAEVSEVAREVAVVEFCKESGDALEYVRFCEEDVRPWLKDVVWAWQGGDLPNAEN